MDGHDLGSIDVDLAEDLAKGVLAELVWDGGVAPERAELKQQAPGASEAQLVGWHRLRRGRPFEPALHNAYAYGNGNIGGGVNTWVTGTCGFLLHYQGFAGR